MATTINTNNKPTYHGWKGSYNQTQATKLISTLEFNTKRSMPELFKSKVHANYDMNRELNGFS